ncbi:hypothetical protein OK016_11670 [Vibrio chagasii]|nr:hypothetical protein [Vibrio chagasii]
MALTNAYTTRYAMKYTIVTYSNLDADVAINKFEMEREHVVHAWKQWMEV